VDPTATRGRGTGHLLSLLQFAGPDPNEHVASGTGTGRSPTATLTNHHRNRTSSDPYHRFPLSFREIEEMMLARGVVVSHETIRQWSVKFGAAYAETGKTGGGGSGWSASAVWWVEVFGGFGDGGEAGWRCCTWRSRGARDR
jgi:hypothetical protein